jgi:formiminoglutamase
MEKLHLFTQKDLNKITNHQSGEIKFGEKMLVIPPQTDWLNYVAQCEAQYIIIGIPEDVGVMANIGRQGTSSCWDSAIQAIANIQHNKYAKGSKILVLGQFNFLDEMNLSRRLDCNNIADKLQINKLVERIDKEVSHLVYLIHKARKTPILIGGGQNNAYGAIKGLALSKGKPVNAINFNSHANFRITDGRHSGNGFSYAFQEGFLKKYYVFGAHENYLAKSVSELIKNKENIAMSTYESIKIREENNFKFELNQALKFVQTDAFGVEIGLNALPNIASSSMTISGFSIEELRQFVHHFGQDFNSEYLHISEGAPDLTIENNRLLIGKLIAYLVTDFIKAKELENLQRQVLSK